jgi:hypothetical protein
MVNDFTWKNKRTSNYGIHQILEYGYSAESNNPSGGKKITRILLNANFYYNFYRSTPVDSSFNQINPLYLIPFVQDSF